MEKYNLRPNTQRRNRSRSEPNESINESNNEIRGESTNNDSQINFVCPIDIINNPEYNTNSDIITISPHSEDEFVQTIEDGAILITAETDVIDGDGHASPRRETRTTEAAETNTIQPIKTTTDEDNFTKLINLIQMSNINVTNAISGLETKFKNEIGSLSDKFDSQNAELKNDIKQCQTSLEYQINTIRLVQSNLQLDVEELKNNQSAQDHKLKLIQESVITDLNKHKTHIKEDISIEFEKRAETTKALINSTNQQIIETINNTITQQTSKLNNKIDEIRDEQNRQINFQNENITHMHQQILENKNKLEDLKSNPDTTSHTKHIQVHVTCPGSQHMEMPIPKFNGRGNNPREFIEKLTKYYKRSLINKNPHVDDTEHMIDLIETSLESHASQWFNLIKSELRDWDSFYRAFNEKYWSRDTQRGIKHRLEVGKYRNNGKLNRSEYFIERVTTLKSLTPPMTEEEIVILLADHFDELTQDARRVQNVNTVKDFEALLLREDLKGNDKSLKGRTQPNQSPSKTNYPPENYRKDWRGSSQNQNHHQTNFRAYQPQNRSYDQRNQQTSPKNHYYNKDQQLYNRNYPRYTQNAPEPRNYPTDEQNKVCTMITNTQQDPSKQHMTTDGRPLNY